MMRFKAKDPVLNAIAGELAYLIAPLGLDLRAAHIWSERNDICDHLSRLSNGERPNRKELAGAVQAKRQPVPNFLLKNLVDPVDRPGTTKENPPCQMTSGGHQRRNTIEETTFASMNG